jgi:hypothetical protein
MPFPTKSLVGKCPLCYVVGESGVRHRNIINAELFPKIIYDRLSSPAELSFVLIDRSNGTLYATVTKPDSVGFPALAVTPPRVPTFRQQLPQRVTVI